MTITTDCVGQDRINRALKNIEKWGGYLDENGKKEELGKIEGGWLKSGGKKLQDLRKIGWVGDFFDQCRF